MPPTPCPYPGYPSPVPGHKTFWEEHELNFRPYGQVPWAVQKLKSSDYSSTFLETDPWVPFTFVILELPL